MEFFKKYIFTLSLTICVLALFFVSLRHTIFHLRQRSTLQSKVSNIKSQIDLIDIPAHSPESIRLYQSKIEEKRDIFNSIALFFSKPSMLEPVEVEKDPIRFVGYIRAAEGGLRSSYPGILPADIGLPITVPAKDQIPIITKQLRILRELTRIWSDAGVKRVISIGKFATEQRQIEGTNHKYSIYPFIFTVEGSYEDILKLLMLLNKSDFLFVVESVNMHLITGPSDRRRLDIHPVQAEIRLSTYVFASPLKVSVNR